MSWTALSTRRWLPAALRLRGFSTAAPSPLSDASTKEQIIQHKLNERFSPSLLQIEDVSGGCGTFFAITIASEAFKGIPMVKQHKLVTQTLKVKNTIQTPATLTIPQEEIEGIHGLQIKTIQK